MKRAGFTLVELLIVIAIIGVLAGLVMAAVTRANAKAKEAVAKTMIDNIRTAMTNYHEDVGYYPSGGAENDEGIINLVLALYDPSEAEGGKGGPNSPYYDFKESDLEPSKSSSGSKVLIDPWGSPWRYVRARDAAGNIKDGVHSRHSYDLWSIGPNKIDDHGEKDIKNDKDDIASWQ